MKSAKKNVRKKINSIRARKERFDSEFRDDQFKERYRRRFKLPKSGTAQGLRLNVNGEVITDQDAVLRAWAKHFGDLGKSRTSESTTLTNLESLIAEYRCVSFENEDFLLDYDITLDEIVRAVKLLKQGKACGPDNILPEHIIYGGDYLYLRLKKIFNEIINLEKIPSSFKDTIIIPIYKGKGKDPLLTKNYRGISLSSVVGKLFERVLLLRMTPLLDEKSIPHVTQTAYQAGVSCSDATAVVQEVVKRYVDSGAAVFQCLYDLEKAFDSVEHDVLLYHLFKTGINGKGWRVIGDFYKDVEACVRLDTSLSHSFQLRRGVKQGSVLSPLLFLLVIDSLLAKLESSAMGATLNNIYLGSLGHADNLRSITPNIDLLEQQATIVKKFADENGLMLNLEKLELQKFSNIKPSPTSMSLGDTIITSSSNTTCLGVSWSHDLSPVESIANNLDKARRAFFAQQSNGIAHGKQNPLTASEQFQVCVLPVCLYGAENWLLTEPMMIKLEQFQAKFGKKILNIPRHHSNLVPLVALDWPTMRLRILHKKLGFLWKHLHPEKKTISVAVFESLRSTNVEPLLVQQCKFLEQVYNTNYTDALLLQQDDTPLNLNTVKKALREEDRDYIWSEIHSHESLAALNREINWPKLWDNARDHGIQGSRSLIATLQVITTPVFKEGFSCHICGHKYNRNCFPARHIMEVHLNRPLDTLLDLLKHPCEETFEVAATLKSVTSRTRTFLSQD